MIGSVGFLRRFREARGGAAAIEMSLIGTFLVGAMINAVEIGRYGVALMQVNNAAQTAIAAAYRACDTEHLPATENCPALAATLAAALRSTSLGTQVTLEGQATEGWYCLNGARQLVYMASPSAKPANCSAVQNPDGLPGLYLSVQARYDYAPIFTGVTLGASFATPVLRTAMARML